MSLQDLCIKNIADSIQNCPPLIQELVIGRSTCMIKEDIKKEITKELTKELTEKIRKNETSTIRKYIKSELKYMIPVIVSDIITSTHQGRPRTNFIIRWWDQDLDIVNTAIEIAEEISEQNIYNNNQMRYNVQMDSDSDSDSDSDDGYGIYI